MTDLNLILLLAVIGLSLVAFVTIKAYDRLLREITRLKEERELVEARARHKAVVIVEEARDKALEILREARIEAETKREALSHRLDNVTDRQVDDYKQVLQSITKAVEDGALRELSEFRKAMEMETVNAQDIVGKKIEEQYAQLQKEIEAAKKSKLEELDKKLVAVIKEAGTRVLGRILTVEDHQDLVVQALEDAKKNNVL